MAEAQDRDVRSTNGDEKMDAVLEANVQALEAALRAKRAASGDDVAPLVLAGSVH